MWLGAELFFHVYALVGPELALAPQSPQWALAQKSSEALSRCWHTPGA